MISKTKKKKFLNKLFLFNIQNLISISLINITTALIIGINPETVFLLNGLSNLAYLILNKFKLPSYIIPNLMFISPIIILLQKYKYELILSSFILYGILFFFTGLIIKYYGFYWLNYLLPPSLLGIIITIMGLDLSLISIQKLNVSNWKLMFVFLSTFLVIIISSLFWNKYLSVPILMGLIFGYVSSLFLKIINFEKIYETPWFILPKIYFPEFNIEVLPIILPIFLMSLIEYISFLIIIKEKYIYKSIMINSILNIIFSFFGSIPFTFYNENIELVSFKEFNFIIFISSIFFIFISFLGKFFIFIKLIPMQIIIGISLFIYGLIISSGIKIIIDSNIDMNNFQNILLVFITFMSGIVLKLVYKNIEIKGLILTIIVGLILNLLFKFINLIKVN